MRMQVTHRSGTFTYIIRIVYYNRELVHPMLQEGTSDMLTSGDTGHTTCTCQVYIVVVWYYSHSNIHLVTAILSLVVMLDYNAY